MEEMYCADGEYSSSTNASMVQNAGLMAAGQLPDPPAGIPADAVGAVTEAMSVAEQNARTLGLT